MVGHVREVGVECRPRPAAHRPWVAEPQPDLQPDLQRARRAELRGLARAAQRVQVPSLVRRDQQPAQGDPAQMLERAPGRRPAS